MSVDSREEQSSTFEGPPISDMRLPPTAVDKVTTERPTLTDDRMRSTMAALTTSSLAKRILQTIKQTEKTLPASFKCFARANGNE
jgi:hypothetical protein